ncbi:MAG: hypothetical protein U0165_05405 [Polyangiaceae bacterium]
MSGEAATLPEGLEAHPQDLEGRVARWVPLVVLCTVIATGALWWAMAGRPPHLPPPPVQPGTLEPHAKPHPTAQPGSDTSVGDIGDAAETACDVCDCMSGLDCGALDCSGCDCAGCDLGGCDLGGCDCGGCDVSCNVANATRVGSAPAKTCARRPSAFRGATMALSLAAPLFVMGVWRKRRLRKHRNEPSEARS